MKKNILFIFLLVLSVFTFVACTDNTPADPEIVTVSINLTGTDKTISASDAANLDLKSLFTISHDGANISVTDDMLSSGGFKAEPGDYTITLSYNNQTAVSKIKVVDDKVLNPDPEVQVVTKTIELASSNEIVEVSAAEDLDLRKLFSIKDDGQVITVTNSMIDNGGYTSEVGTYTVVLTYKEKTATSIVKVVNDYAVSIMVNPEYTTVLKGTEDIDLTKVFSAYIGSEPTEITEDMVSGSIDLNRTGRYNVTLNYDRYGEVYNQSAIITVLPDVQFNLPNGDYFEAAGVYQANNIFKNENNFKVKVDGIDIALGDLTFDSNFAYVPDSNKIATGEYKTRCSFTVNGVEFYKDINYKIFEHNIKLSHSDSGKTYKKSELTSDNFDVFDIISVKVDDYSITSSYCNLQFVEASNAEGVTPDEGKRLVPYTVTSNIVYGTLGTYEVTLAFEVDGRTFTDTSVVNIVSDVEITAKSSAALSIFAGAESYDYTTLFTVKKYNAESDSNETVTVTADMITSDVDFSTPGTYKVTCAYEDVSLDKEVLVVDAPFVGSYTALDNENFTLTINPDGSVSINDNGSTKSGTITVREDGSLSISASGTFICWYVDGILTYDRNHTAVTEDNCHILAKDPTIWSVTTVSGYKNNISSLVDEGDTKYTITQLTSNDVTVNVVFEYSLTYSSYYYGDEYGAAYYVNPAITGTLFQDSCDITLGDTVVVFTFADGALTAANKPSSGNTETPETPETPEVAPETGTYTGEYGDITLDGEGKASGEYFPANKTISYIVKENNVIGFTYTDSNYTKQYFEIIITKAEEGNGTYVINETDGLVYKYSSLVSSSTSITFFGYGNFDAYGVFAYSTVSGTYDWDKEAQTVALTYTDSDDVTTVLTYKFTNYENNLELVSVSGGELYSESARSFLCTTVRNYRLSSTKAYLPKDSALDVTKLFKIEYLDENGEVQLKEVNSTMVDVSAVDMNKAGYYVATIKFEENEVIYQAAALIQVYEAIYEGYDEVGTYNFGSGYSTYSLTLNDDGTAIYSDYNEYTGKWYINDEGQIIASLTRATTYSTYYKDIVATYDNGVLTAFEDNKTTPTLMAKDGKQIDYYYYEYEVEEQEKTATLYIYEIKGIEHFYWIDNATITEVKVRWNSMEIEEGSILNIYIGESMIEAQVEGSYLIGAGVEKGTWSGSKGSIVFDGFGNATIAGASGKYTLNDVKATITSGGSTFVVELNYEQHTYVELVADAFLGTYTNSPYYFQLDGFGAGIYYRSSWTQYEITYSYDAETKVLTICTISSYTGNVDDTFTFSIDENGSITCLTSTYSGYVSVGSVWTKA